MNKHLFHDLQYNKVVEKINDMHQNITKQWGQVTPIALL
jgi:hypothetical protein